MIRRSYGCLIFKGSENMKEISNALSDAIFTVCNKIISKAKFDKTYKCRVVSKVSEGKYIVMKDDIEHIVNSVFTYNIGDIVTVLLPQNSWTNATIVYPQFDTDIINDVSSLTNNVSLLSNRMKVAETSIKLSDTRSDNNTPEWYIQNHSMKMVAEFKYCTAINITKVTGYTYTPLITIVPWSDISGGYPRQIAWSGTNMYHRVGVSTTEWGDWVQLDVVA